MKMFGGNLPPTAQDFQNELEKWLETAQREGKSYLDVISGELHRAVGGYPGQSHRMPVCCEVMRKNMKPGDQVLQEPPKGKGASLTIRYNLSR